MLIDLIIFSDFDEFAFSDVAPAEEEKFKRSWTQWTERDVIRIFLAIILASPLLLSNLIGIN